MVSNLLRPVCGRGYNLFAGLCDLEVSAECWKEWGCSASLTVNCPCLLFFDRRPSFFFIRSVELEKQNCANSGILYDSGRKNQTTCVGSLANSDNFRLISAPLEGKQLPKIGKVQFQEKKQKREKEKRWLIIETAGRAATVQVWQTHLLMWALPVVIGWWWSCLLSWAVDEWELKDKPNIRLRNVETVKCILQSYYQQWRQKEKTLILWKMF